MLPATVQPRATGHVPEMLALTQRLVDAGFAYPSGGSVWFRVGAFADYGALSHQRPSTRCSPRREAEPGKTDPRDFALWKARRRASPSWSIRRGVPGRPGWHLECSAMAASTSATPSTFTAAASIWSSRTTRTSVPRRCARAPVPPGRQARAGDGPLLDARGSADHRRHEDVEVVGQLVLRARRTELVRPQVPAVPPARRRTTVVARVRAESLVESTAAHDRRRDVRPQRAGHTGRPRRGEVARHRSSSDGPGRSEGGDGANEGGRGPGALPPETALARRPQPGRSSPPRWTTTSGSPAAWRPCSAR